MFNRVCDRTEYPRKNAPNLAFILVSITLHLIRNRAKKNN